VKSLALVVLIATIVLLCDSSCVTDLGDETFIVRVDSVHSPESIQLNQTIAFYLFGTIGYDGRYSFSHFQVRRSSSQTELTVWGRKRELEAYNTAVWKLDGGAFRIAPTNRGNFILAIRQPDGSLLRDTVLVQ
jgi:hypothetical protein